MRTLRVTLIFIGIVQSACGAVFLVFQLPPRHYLASNPAPRPG
jgi:hypothetical protein